MAVRPVATGAGMAMFAERFNAIGENVGRVLEGKSEAVRLALTCLVAQGHLLIEDTPGVGKTSLAKALASSIDCEWKRIQFTPDLLPTEVTGVNVYRRVEERFEFRPGGVFANVVLADEINRASPRTQSALLEAMEERQVSVDGVTYELPAPFLVVATQNPMEHAGTYPLPDSQLDRFLMRIELGFPDRSSELAMLETHGRRDPLSDLGPVAEPGDILSMAAMARTVHITRGVADYIVRIAEATRREPGMSPGVSPRGSLSLQAAARAWAAAEGRDYVVPDDVKAVALPVLAHRLASSTPAELVRVTELLEEVLSEVSVPTARDVG